MTPFQKKTAAAQATLDRFKDQPLRLGRNDCARMVAFHLRKLGHKVKLPPAGAYGSVKGALREMQARGWESLSEAVDAIGLDRIPAAAAEAGDILQLPGEGPLGALTIAMGNGRVCGYHEDARGAVVMQPVAFVAAWRVPAA